MFVCGPLCSRHLSIVKVAVSVRSSRGSILFLEPCTYVIIRTTKKYTSVYIYRRGMVGCPIRPENNGMRFGPDYFSLVLSTPKVRDRPVISRAHPVFPQFTTVDVYGGLRSALPAEPSEVNRGFLARALTFSASEEKDSKILTVVPGYVFIRDLNPRPSVDWDVGITSRTTGAKSVAAARSGGLVKWDGLYVVVSTSRHHMR